MGGVESGGGEERGLNNLLEPVILHNNLFSWY